MPSKTPDLLPAQELFKETKPGIRYYRILKILPSIPKETPNRPYIEEMDRILSQLDDLQANAAKLESQGKTEHAVALYKQLVEAQFDNPHPYLRLCDYYTKKRNPEQVDHICYCYLQMAQTLTALGYGQPYREELVHTHLRVGRNAPIKVV